MGPYAHLVLAQRHGPQLLEAMGLQASGRIISALLMGSIAPDAGFYPGADARLAALAHHERPWHLGRAMWQSAAAPLEKGFALGWLSHLAADKRGHRDLVNPQCDNNLDHERLEWGLDCHLLGQAECQWLWHAVLDARTPAGLWARALCKTHGLQGAEPLMQKALKTEKVNMRLIPWLKVFSGHARPENHPACCRLGDVLGGPLETLLLAVCRGFKLGRSVEALLNPIPPGSMTLEQWRILQREHGNDLFNAVQAAQAQE